MNSKGKPYVILWLLLVGLSIGDGHLVPSNPLQDCSICPTFIKTEQDVRTPLGIDANLTCGVRHLNDRQVSWIRKKDLHVLTTDSFTFTTDSRFKALHKDHSPYWILSIEHPMINDSGVYECQISTQPKIFRRFKLTVVVPQAKIIGPSEIFMKTGSDINITCQISEPSTKSHVKWYHISTAKNSQVIEEINAGKRGGVQLVTDRRIGISWLLVASTTWRDSGNYTCAPAFARPTSIIVHIIDKVFPAAMHRDVPSSSSSFSFFWVIAVSFTSSGTALFHCIYSWWIFSLKMNTICSLQEIGLDRKSNILNSVQFGVNRLVGLIAS